jgi:signal transduction histidine kinase
VHVVAGLPFARVQATANQAFARTLAALIMVTLFVIASAIFAAEFSVLRVLRSLTRAVRQFGAGDLAARPPLPSGRGELRELALAFGSMADALAARQHEAEQARDRLRVLSHHLQVVRDEEAQRIARELHDELGQVLTGLKMELAGLRRLHAGQPREADHAAALGQMQARLDEAIDSVRRISAELRPPVLDRLGLAAALDWLISEWESKSRLALVLNVTGLDEGPVDERISIAIFRVVQEALTNVVRHAQATEVHVDLAASSTGILLTIEDDGRGFEPLSVSSPLAVGIHGMRERVQLLGGTFRIVSGARRGTRVEVAVPRQPVPIDAILEGGRLPA